MKSLWLIVFCLFSAAEGSFEARENLSFQIKAIYKGEGINQLGVIGNGLGLELDQSQPMLKTEEDGVWTFDIVYKSDLHGFKCMNCSSSSEGFIPNGDDLKISFWATPTDKKHMQHFAAQDMGELAMIGDVFRISLPQSKVSNYFEQKPELVFYPYFFATEGDFETLQVKSDDEAIGTRQMVIYLPPGFKENPKPEYDVYYGIDLSPLYQTLFQNELNQIFMDGVAHDAVVIGHGDWTVDPVTMDSSTDRGLQLTPIESPAFICKEGTLLDNCNNCLPANMTSGDYIYWMTVGGCGIQITTGGNAEANVEFLLTNVYQTVDQYLKLDYGSGLTKSREGTFIFGYSLGGLFSCHAAWTRPESFGGAACLSPSFWWPLVVSEDSPSAGFYFENSILKTHLDDRLPQRIIIDVGVPEEDPLFQMVSASERAFDIVAEHPMFQANKNVWYHTYPNEEHSFFSLLKRVWNTFKILAMERN